MAKKLTRFAVNINDATPDRNGEFVRYDEYANLETKYEARLKELETMKSARLRLVMLAHLVKKHCDAIDQWEVSVEKVIGRQPQTGASTKPLRNYLDGLKEFFEKSYKNE